VCQRSCPGECRARRHSSGRTRLPIARLRTLRLLWSRPHRQLVGSTHLSTKVALCERATRAGLEVALERECAIFVRELHGDDQLPGSMLCGVMAAAGVVPLDSSRHVAGHTCVEAFAIADASKSVDKVFGHSDSSGNRNAAWSALTSLEIQGIYDCTIAICDMSEALVCCGFCSAWAGQSSVRLRLARLAVAHTWLNTRDDVRLRPFGATARQPSHLIMSEGWWT
jgi:hypothetical protein